ncbi:seryl-tRNA synthetase [Magnaporthiopsis poae ATCC 64411]|uniref:serine--tRNA ligase n=1 Tax=Magnaporthiopsis poae (strain ATCC 64411 / 73-15) TaxID=644358 RepID=A0A0C4DLR6_MAGP6|nr:seryl-tRNA synthetase [Magnaporthiopsis poae ATCC 64411]
MRQLLKTLPRLPYPGRAPRPSSLIRRPFHTGSVTRQQSETGTDADTGVSIRPTSAPKTVIDIKHIRQNPALYEQNCIERNYKAQSGNPARINQLHEQWQAKQREGRALRERSNLLRRELANPPSTRDEAEAEGHSVEPREKLIEEARQLKEQLSEIEDAEESLTQEMARLAVALPNLTSANTPRGEEPLVLSYINNDPEQEGSRFSESDRVWRSHVHIGSELGLLDFAGAASSSGWGWYYLLNEGAELEQALVQYALAVATHHGWSQVSPPSIVYSHIADACGFQPRDQNGETQIYTLARSTADAARGKPELSLTATAEIPLAAMKADTQLEESELPARRVAASRCYRAEAGARGADTKGLYRVHEFTKVEMFAWSAPSEAAAEEVFEEMLDIQTEILGSLGLRCRVLEMPTADLGASATRKIDIEAFFPSRQQKNDGWGEVTSASICTDYQTRRLSTRVRFDGKMTFPWTLNGTALAVPRVVAAILENGWDENSMTVKIPEVLRPWMNGKDKISGKHRRK